MTPVQLIYTSRADINAKLNLEHLVLKARHRNTEQGLTGVIMLRDGCFLQVLEGCPEAVNETYARILQDIRHSHAMLLGYRHITRRAFSASPLQWILSGPGTCDVLLRYNGTDRFAPEQMTSEGALAMMSELDALATRQGASRSGATPPEPAPWVQALIDTACRPLRER
jgi:hypothetical protein